MPNIFKTRAKTYVDPSTWEGDNDAALYNLAVDLHECGWNVQYRYHYVKVQTTTDMTHFDPISGGHVFWQITPGADSDYMGDIPLVIDDVGSFVAPAGYFIYEQTGTTEKFATHAAIIRCLKFLDGDLIEIGSDPDDPLPNTYLAYREYGGTPAFPAGALHRNKDVVGGCAVGLHTNTGGGLFFGGYAASCAANGDPDNYTSMFLHRDATGGLNPNRPAVFFAKDIAIQPAIVTMVAGTDRSTTVPIEITRADLLIAIGPSYCYLTQINYSGQDGHLELAALSLPVDGSGIYEATFSIADDSPTSGRFRNGPWASANSLGTHLRRNGVSAYGRVTPNSRPRVQTLYGRSTAGHQWENGLGQITEPWCGFQHAALGTTPVLGKLPDAICVFKALNDPPPFKWDNVTYEAYGKNVIGSTSQGLGTLCFKSAEVAPNPTCVP